MGQAASKEQAIPIITPSPSASTTKTTEEAAAVKTSECPVKHGKTSTGGGCPMKKPSNSPPPKESACPVKQKSSQETQYNVYSQPLDPKNNMPTVANQLPSDRQTEELSTERQKSNIPKGGTDGSTWVYPSPQMFYNALARKNKLDDTTENDISSVVALHNNMNEKTWQKVLEWEAILNPSKQTPKLSRFLGRPSDLSPKARFKNMFLSYPLPFDRHDWTVIRKDGTEVRYVIDYYHDETQASELPDSGFPKMDDHDAVKSILVDVRPALDSVSEFKGRCFTMPLARQMGWSKFQTLPMLPTNAMKGQMRESMLVWDNIQKNAKETKAQFQREKEGKEPLSTPETPLEVSKEDAQQLAKSFAKVLEQCQEERKRMESCDPEESAQASLALSMCMSQIICPLQHQTVVKTLHSQEDDGNQSKKEEAIYEAKVDAALVNMLNCVGRENERVAMAKAAHPIVFKE